MLNRKIEVINQNRFCQHRASLLAVALGWRLKKVRQRDPR